MGDAPIPDAGGVSDEELVRRAKAGEGAAARALFDRHLPDLRAAARKRLPPAARGKLGESDVVQEAYLAAFVDLSRFEDRGDGSFARWLRGILANKIAHEVRRLEAGKRDARREVRLATGVEVRADRARPTQRSPESQAAAAERSGAVRAVLADLPDDYRTIIQLVHADGLTMVEAGARMGRSPDAARMLYGRAMARMSEKMRRRGGA